MEKLCYHGIVVGKVQGVWFRASTCEKAKQLGLSGWVKNLPDGSVEVFACGEKSALQALWQWLEVGPTHAAVDNVSLESQAYEEYKVFEIRR